MQFFDYLIKLSGTLIILYLFYWIILRHLTFYNANRWYLLVYPITAFGLPFINISPFLEKARLTDDSMVKLIPLVNSDRLPGGAFVETASGFWNFWNLAIFILCAGAMLMLLRFIIQFFSFHSVKKSAELISDGPVKVYHTTRNITPFSFGSSIFLNRNNHTEEDLHDIVKHEFIHVKEKHTIDIIIGELICILNWYNPFAWLIRHSIRQNLEFIADKKVLENGIDKKQYQYLLLKVVGVRPYHIATNFNFTSLKTRIAMMNKMRSAKVHIFKFLFVLPVLAVILLAFRNNGTKNNTDPATISSALLFTDEAAPRKVLADTVPPPQKLPVRDRPPHVGPPNSKGYVITIADNHGECIVIVKDKQHKIVKAMSLVEWDRNEKQNVEQYGEILLPPPAPGSPAAPDAPNPPNVPPSPVYADDVSSIHIKDDIVTIGLKNGKTEVYNLRNKEQKEKFDKKYLPVNESQKNRYQQINLDHPSKTQVIIDTKEDSQPVIIDPAAGDSVVEIKFRKQEVVKMENGNVNFKASEDFHGLFIVNDKEYDKKSFEKLNLNGSNIKSIDVFKNETAIAIYGDKGKEGVIKITTK